VKEPNWQTVFQSTDEIQVRIKKMKLEDEGIPVMIFDQRDSSYNAFGYLYIDVRIEDVERATEILNSQNE
jgi:hypothetical protein